MTAAPFTPSERARLASLLSGGDRRRAESMPVWVPVAGIALVTLCAALLVLAGQPWVALAGMVAIPVVLAAFSRADRLVQLVLFMI